MSNPIDLDAWQQALADRQTVADAQRRFEQHRFTIPEQDRHAAAASIRSQVDQVTARLLPLRNVAEARQRQLEDRLATLVEQRDRLQDRAARGQGSPARINQENRTLQAHISDCAVQLNVLAKLLSAKHADDIAGLGDDEKAFLSRPLDMPLWTGAAEAALPRTVAGAAVIAALAALLPWFATPNESSIASLAMGVAGDATTLAAQVLGYVGILLPIFLVAVALSALRYRSWLIIATALSVTFVWIGVCYARITATVPWWSFPELFAAMRIGAWLYAAAAFTCFVAACYYAQGEGNTVQRSLRTAGWLVILFLLPGLLAAGLLALRPGPPAVEIGVTAVAEQSDVLRLTITNNSDGAIDVSLPWSSETHYGLQLEIKLDGAELFRTLEDTADCWRAPEDSERIVNRMSVAPSVSEQIWFDIGCIRGVGYSPRILRFALTNAEGHTVKAFKAIIPE